MLKGLRYLSECLPPYRTDMVRLTGGEHEHYKSLLIITLVNLCQKPVQLLNYMKV